MADEGVKGSDPADQCDDAFLKKIESSMLSQVKLQGIQGIKKVTIRNVSRLVVRPEDGQGYFQENEWMLDTEGVNLQEVCCSIPHMRSLASPSLFIPDREMADDAAALPNTQNVLHLGCKGLCPCQCCYVHEITKVSQIERQASTCPAFASDCFAGCP